MVTRLSQTKNVGWHALRYSEGRGFSRRQCPRPSEYLRACHPPFRVKTKAAERRHTPNRSPLPGCLIQGPAVGQRRRQELLDRNLYVDIRLEEVPGHGVAVGPAI